MNNNKFKISVFSICMYVFAAILLIYFIYLMVQTKTFISDAVEAGQVSLENDMADIVRHYVTTCGTYFIYTVVFVAFGYIGNLVFSIVQRGANTASVASDNLEADAITIAEVEDGEIKLEESDVIAEEIDVEDVGVDNVAEEAVEEAAADVESDDNVVEAEVVEEAEEINAEATEADDDVEIFESPADEEK